MAQKGCKSIAWFPESIWTFISKAPLWICSSPLLTLFLAENVLLWADLNASILRAGLCLVHSGRGECRKQRIRSTFPGCGWRGGGCHQPEARELVGIKLHSGVEVHTMQLGPDSAAENHLLPSPCRPRWREAFIYKKGAKQQVCVNRDFGLRRGNKSCFGINVMIDFRAYKLVM